MSIELSSFLIVSSVALNIFYTFYLLRQHRKASQNISESINALEEKTGLLTKSIVGVGQRVSEFDQQFGNLLLKQEESENLSVSTASTTSYAQAGKFIEKGASVDEVVTNCGVTRPEAELLKRIQDYQSEKHN